MNKFAALLTFVVGSVLFAGCASGPQFSDVKGTLPTLAPEMSRVYFYRTALMGAAIQPDVRLNGEVVGSAKPQGAFYIDRSPGEYKVETSTEVTRQLSLVLAKGQTRYVRLNLSMGFMVGHVYPELVDAAVGERELAGCKFTGGGK